MKMVRTYVDIIGDYYDNLDKIIDLQDEMDRRQYDISQIAKSVNYPNDL